jgi:hypothetical protein
MDGERPGPVTEHQMTQPQQRKPIGLWAFFVGCGLVVASFVMFFGVFFLPVTVDAVGYLAGAGGHGTFTATDSFTTCTYSGSATLCGMTTDGYLDPGHIPASWPGQVHGSFPVRRPVWIWGIINAPLFNEGSAILFAVALGCIQLAIVGAVFFGAYRGYRAWRSARRGRTRGRPAMGAHLLA